MTTTRARLSPRRERHPGGGADRGEGRLLTAVARAAAALLADGNDDFAATVSRGLRLLGEGAAVDRVVILQHAAAPAPDGSAPGWLETRFRWEAPGVAKRFPLDPCARPPYLPGGYERLRAGEPACGRTADLSEPWRSEVARAAVGVRSFALVPVFMAGAYWGTLCFDSCRRTRRWRPQEITALQAAAACVGASLERRRAAETLLASQREKQAAAQARATELARVNAAVHGSLTRLAEEPGLDRFVGHVLDELNAQVSAACAALFTFDPHANTLSMQAMRQQGRWVLPTSDPRLASLAAPIAADLTPFWHRLIGGRHVWHAELDGNDAEQGAEFWPGTLEWHLRQGHRALVEVPLLLGERPLGFIGLCFRHPQPLSAVRLGLVQALAHQMTLALELARLADEARHAAVTGEQEAAARRRAQELGRANDLLQAEVVARRRAEELARGQANALTRTLTLLAADPALEGFLGQVLTAVTEALGAPAATLYFYDPAADTLTLHLTCHGDRVLAGPDQLGHPNALVPFRADLNGFWRVLVATRRPVEIVDVENDPLLEHHDWLSRAGVRSLLIAPLVSGERTLGCLGVRFYEGPRRCRPEELELATALAQLATLAVELTRLGGQAREHAVAEERNRLAREIHDTIAQGLVGIFVQLQGARQAVTADATADALVHLDHALDLAETSLAEARRSVAALRPGVLESGRDLVAAFGALVARLSRAGPSTGREAPLTVELRHRGRRRPLPPETEGELLRIGQEALANAVRHAGARWVRLTVAFTPKRVRVEVADDGRGFEPNVPTQGDGRPRFGLLGMRERTARLGGHLTLRSGPGRGTRVTVSVPV